MNTSAMLWAPTSSTKSSVMALMDWAVFMSVVSR